MKVSKELFTYEALIGMPPAQPKDEAEKFFNRYANFVGFITRKSIELCCSTPVYNKNGELDKHIYNSDLTVFDPITLLYTLVEITTGKGVHKNKMAQMRVLRQVESELGISIPHVIINGPQLEELFITEKPLVKPLMMAMLGWKTD